MNYNKVKFYLRKAWVVLSLMSILFMVFHFWDGFYYLMHSSTEVKEDLSIELTASQKVSLRALTDILTEDKVLDPEKWALAIIKHSPSSNAAYLALIAGQIRRESKFNTPDLEWLYDRIIPDSLHQTGLEDKVTTVGVLQIKKEHLRKIMKEEDSHYIKTKAYSIDTGVAAAIKYLDLLIKDHFPNRNLKGWATLYGRQGWNIIGQQNRDIPFEENMFYKAAFQKMISDLIHKPLILDGIIGNRTLKGAALFGNSLSPQFQDKFIESIAMDLSENEYFQDTHCYKKVKDQWSAVYGDVQGGIFPRITHDPLVAFIFADFNVGRFACKISAMQFMINTLLDCNLNTDGILGPATKDKMLEFLKDIISVDDELYQDYEELLYQNKKRNWVISQFYSMISKEWTKKTGKTPISGLIPNLETYKWTQKVKNIPSMSVADYASGSSHFYEDYLNRLIIKIRSYK